jgi:hypothetical protein
MLSTGAGLALPLAKLKTPATHYTIQSNQKILAGVHE